MAIQESLIWDEITELEGEKVRIDTKIGALKTYVGSFDDSGEEEKPTKKIKYKKKKKVSEETKAKQRQWNAGPASRAPRKCSNCGKIGHQARTCKESLGGAGLSKSFGSISDDDEDPSENDLNEVETVTLLSDDEESDLAKDIESMQRKGLNSLAICNELHISLKQFNSINKKHLMER